MSKSTAIAIDGPGASGKTSVGRLCAQRLDYRFLDTGAMYRAVTWEAHQKGIEPDDEDALVRLAESLKFRLVVDASQDRLLVDGKDAALSLHHPEVDRRVSLVARFSGVRRALVRHQRDIASKGPIVVVGRDIGTVVLPNAPIKVFLTASPEVRAQRRYLELQSRGEEADYQKVMNELIRRDKIDTERADSPLRPADDAFQIATDCLGIEELALKIENLVGHTA